MFYRRYIPPPPLEAFIQCLWYSEGLQGTHERERLLPNGESGIVFNLRESLRIEPRSADSNNPCEAATYAPSVFCGARTDYFLLDTSEQERVIGIQFRPGGAFPFLGIPASEVANCSYALEDIWPRQAPLIREQLLCCETTSRMFQVLEGALLNLLRQGRELHPAVAFAAAQLSRASGDTRVQQVVDRIGLSARHFKEIFREQTGISPKAFQRVRRFQHVLQSLRKNRDVPPAELAAECGYYDQPHFIHDFKHFSGFTPGEYLTLATPHLNHIPLA